MDLLLLDLYNESDRGFFVDCRYGVGFNSARPFILFAELFLDWKHGQGQKNTRQKIRKTLGLPFADLVLYLLALFLYLFPSFLPSLTLSLREPTLLGIGKKTANKSSNCTSLTPIEYLPPSATQKYDLLRVK